MSGKKCSICGTDNPIDELYCTGCGVELSNPVLDDSAAFEHTGATTEEPGLNGIDSSLPVGHDDSSSSPENEPFSQELYNDSKLDPTPSSSELVSEPTPPQPSEESGDASLVSYLIAKRYGAITTERIALSGGRLIVGRFDPSSGPVDIDVSAMPGAEHISRRHAELYFDEGNWKVRDLGSTNGVFIKRNGADQYEPRLQEPATLSDGDEVAFGNVVFVFREAP